MHVDEAVAPRADEDSPAAHRFAQFAVDALSVLPHRPAEQDVHEVAPAAAYVPAPQGPLQVLTVKPADIPK